MKQESARACPLTVIGILVGVGAALLTTRAQLNYSSASVHSMQRAFDEVTERCHGYQNYFFSLWTRPPNRTTLEAGIHTSARSSRQPCLNLHRCAPPVQRPPTTGNSSAL